ncbi:helix-turn-helix transcriptional regulator [Saccharomonospora sp. NPDC046836]|uniref:helix-turn-helix domain-containing protein n=1 Tax=Saccharomonospora sp. NPDC046836 TaxID=3156921 RepID=UPI0033DB0D52
MTQQEVADLLNTTQSWVSKAEKGKLVPGLAELRSIASKLHIPRSGWAFCPTPPPTPSPSLSRSARLVAPRMSRKSCLRRRVGPEAQRAQRPVPLEAAACRRKRA